MESFVVSMALKIDGFFLLPKNTFIHRRSPSQISLEKMSPPMKICLNFYYMILKHTAEVIPENLAVFFSVGSQLRGRIFDWHETHPFSVDSLGTLFARQQEKAKYSH